MTKQKNLITTDYNSLDKDNIYIFFEKHRRFGNNLDSFFSNLSSSIVGLQAYFTKKHSLPIVSHIGLIFFDSNDSKWQIAELDYFQGGKIIRGLQEKESDKYVVSVLKTTKSDIERLHKVFPDKFVKKNWFYSLLHYSFLNGLKLLTPLWLSIVIMLLFALDFILFLFSPYLFVVFLVFLVLASFDNKSRNNCIDVVFEYLEYPEEKKNIPQKLFEDFFDNNKSSFYWVKKN